MEVSLHQRLPMRTCMVKFLVDRRRRLEVSYVRVGGCFVRLPPIVTGQFYLMAANVHALLCS